jgi:ASPM-SPD-2-Hydin domain-containing protein/centrosomal CEP192-like protein/NHL repeat-containing protein
MNKILLLVFLAFLAPAAYADQGGFSNSGGSTQVSAGVTIDSSVATPPGSLTIHCPQTTPTHCADGSFAYLSNDGTVTINATFTSATFTESCSGGGRGGRVTCGYSFTGYISGTWTVNGAAQAISGVTYQAFGTGGAAARGTTAFNSAYSPFYYSDTEQIHRSDDLQGTNQISFGSQGGGVGQLYGAYGLALDSAGRIYVADTYNCRIVRIDDMTGTNWTSYGDTCGSGQGQFYDPQGIAVDSAGGVYVMDTGNSRFVHMDDMNGTNWISYGTVGSGVGEFLSYVSVAVDASNRIYVADGGNRRIVRIDDMNGTNWTELAQSPPVNGVSQSFCSPAAVAPDSAGRVYVADNCYAPRVVRVDDMTGANWTSRYIGASGGPGLNSMSVDSGGTVFTAGGGVRLVDNMTAVLTSSGTIGPIGSYYIFGVTSLPVSSPRPSAVSVSPATLTFALQDVGTSSNSQPVTLTNFGGSTLNFSGIAASAGFAETSDCPNSLVAGASCTVSVSFAPTAAGPATGSLTLNDDSGNLGASQTVTLVGTGSLPRHLTLSPATLNFCCPTIGDSSSQAVGVANTSSASAGIAGIAMSGDPSLVVQGSTCGSALPAGATCTVTVAFNPAAYGTFTSTLIVTESSGGQETVSVTATASPDN